MHSAKITTFEKNFKLQVNWVNLISALEENKTNLRIQTKFNICLVGIGVNYKPQYNLPNKLYSHSVIDADV